MATYIGPYHGKEASVKVGTAVTISTTSTLWAQANGTDFSGECKDISFNPGDHPVEALNVFGAQLVDESRHDMATFDFTMVFSDLDIWALSFATASVASGTATERFQGTDNTGVRTSRSVGFKVANATKGTVHILVNNAFVTSPGEVTLAADGSAEQTFSVSALIGNIYVERV